MRKITLIASGVSMFIGGYFLGRRKFKKLFETVYDVSKEEYEDYVSTFNENDKLWNENLRLDEENTNLKEEISKLEILNNDYEKYLLDIYDLIKDKNRSDTIAVWDIFEILIQKHDIMDDINWHHSSDYEG